MGGQIWKIINPNKENNDNHSSETEYQQVKEDKLILNDGSLEDLYKKIELNLVN